MNSIKKQRLITKTGLLVSVIFFAFICLGACNKEVFGKNEQDKTKDDATIPELPYKISGTNQTRFYDNNSVISSLTEASNFYGQDANYVSETNYTNNGDGTITDNITGLMWQQNPGNKMTYDEAVSGVAAFNQSGYSDWRLPTIKELYSLIIFSGIDPSGYNGSSTSALVPFIDTDYFGFEYGNPADGDRIIDSQFATSTLDAGDSDFGGGNLMFGVNFADGRIKGYPIGPMPGKTSGKTFFVIYVRGNENYSINNFTDNGNGTVTDATTGLIWMQNDSDNGMNWQDALKYAEEKTFAGYSDWRLPNIKELQSIVDYSRAPGTTNSAAINPVFNCSQIINEGGQEDYPYYWSGTTHENMQNSGSAAYISFGSALGYFNGAWQDVHGAGAQRSDPKAGNAGNWKTGRGPQGDAIRIDNYVRLVRNAN